MARIYPRLSEAELQQLPSRAEAKVYRLLRDLDFDGLEVMHSLATQTHNSKGTWVGEIDFLLFHPHHGIQLWEVKGGGISLDGEGRWWSEGRNGKHRLGTTPLEQLKKQTASLVQALEKIFGNSLRLPIAPVLVFPDTTEWQGTLPELALNPDHLLLKDELSKLTPASILRRFTNTAHAGTQASNDLPLNKSQAELIRHRLLRPACALVANAAEQAKDVESALFRLSHEQQWVLRLLEHLPRMAIYGGAGTGKSVLARLQAQHLAQQNKKVLLLCFNIALAEHHRTELAADPETTNRIEVQTFHQLCQSRAEQTGLGWPQPAAEADFAALNTFYNQTAPDLLAEALQRQPEQWDALIVDEAQDYEPWWWLVINELLHDESHVTLFADPAQNLYLRQFELPADVFNGMVPYPFTLHRNYRNAYEIAAWLKQHHPAAAEASEHLPSSGQGVQIIRWKDTDQQLELLHEQLNQLEKNGFKPEQILLLTPFKVSKSKTLSQLLQEKPCYQQRAYNIAAIKGLEASVVILVDIGLNEWASNPAFEYVGASRAKVVLILLKILKI